MAKKIRSIKAVAIVDKDNPVISIYDIYDSTRDIIIQEDERAVKVKIEVID